ncbi:MAG: response regulator [Candidatus Cloacimonetes bacterium]|nr:response regulator [Candidatus Cloacimonadota bacterium]
MSKKIILAIDDEQDSLEFITSIVEDENYEIVTANDGDVGVIKAKEIQPDLIILDVQMPKQDGFVTLWELKQVPELREIPVIMLTGVGEKLGKRFSKDEVGDLVGDPPDFYVEKPIDPQKLLDIINEIF